MPPSEPKPAPLPLASDRAALSNRISLLLANRTSLLKTLNSSACSSSSAPSTTVRRSARANLDNDDELAKGTRPNEGVGYVADSTAATKHVSREEKMLRGRLLGKGRGRNGAEGLLGRGRARRAQSESDEEEGRSGLGKRKRPRRELVSEGGPVELLEQSKMTEQGDDEKGKGDDREKQEDVEMDENEAAEQLEASSSTTGKAKNKKKKKKKK